MYNTILQPVVGLGTRILVMGETERPNAQKVLEWIEQNPERFYELLGAFDATVTEFNLHNQSIPDNCKNAHDLRRSLGGTPLPTIESLNGGATRKTLLQFRDVLKDINKMMILGESGATKGDFLRFHKTENTPETLTIAAISHFYEEFVLRNKIVDVKRGQIESGLIEVSANLENSPIWEAIANKQKLDWVNNDKTFTESFRKERGLD